MLLSIFVYIYVIICSYCVIKIYVVEKKNRIIIIIFCLDKNRINYSMEVLKTYKKLYHQIKMKKTT